jgi:hypothetical protein
MPRPAVKPQDRLRSVQACDSCKASKKRCDSKLPCLLCVRKGLVASCTYSSQGKRSRRRRQSSTRIGWPPSPQAQLRSSPGQQRQSQPSPLSYRSVHEEGANHGSVRDEGAGHAAPDLPDSSPSAQRPVMLTSASGEKGKTMAG